MHRFNEDDIDTLPGSLNDPGAKPGIRTDAVTFASAVANFFRKNGSAEAPGSRAPEVAAPSTQAEPEKIGPAISKALLYEHWTAIKAAGITASQFIAFLQPLADLEGIAVSYALSDDDGKPHVYNHRHEDLSGETPLSRAIRGKAVSREKALTFALNAEGKVWIESNFIDLK
jgi:hypothetical protein